jgi:hypothetical protein
MLHRMTDTLVPVAEAKLHVGDIYIDRGRALPPGLDPQHPELDELWRSGALVMGVPRLEGVGQPTQAFAIATVEKYNLPEGVDHESATPEHLAELQKRIETADVGADEVFHGSPNLLVIGGASAFLEFISGNTAALTAFNNANAYIAVGDSSTSAADTQTALQASTNLLRKAMDATYPQHSHSATTAGAKSIVYRSTFGTSDANFAWNEWAIFNAAASGLMLNRKAESLGTKTSAASWVFTATLAMA